ncbi:MAG: serine protease AprX [Solirubrobacteraceae bacterium]|nr:serine protease AprX [Solirubrobacteraceae bacterium]
MRMTEIPGSDPQGEEPEGFTPTQLDRTVLAIPLIHKLRSEREARADDPAREPQKFHVVIDINLEYAKDREQTRREAIALIDEAIKSTGRDKEGQSVNEAKSARSQQYLFALLEGDVIRDVVDRNEPSRPIFRIWPDFDIGPLVNKSVSTVKADAARISFSALGQDIVWAVLDSGIQADHPHFERFGNVLDDAALKPLDFTGTASPLEDRFGHGTHVAGILAGEREATEDHPIRAVTRYRDKDGEIVHHLLDDIPRMAGMAPQCKLLSLKVLDDDGKGVASNLIAAIEYIQELNGNGRRIRVHGVNMSVGYDFEPEWFACGQSPLCVEVDQLVRSGVVVVVAAGNTGYGYLQSKDRGPVTAGMGLTINDPGNADMAITVGATHRDMPHVYGVSYFSSKGPTGDGREKPDLIAPGEKILSAAAGKRLVQTAAKVGGGGQNDVVPDYVEDSGTSMAAPHVSGVIAAFLSVRREFIGRPDRVKDIFLATATDLRRDRHFQGRGLVDVMRAIQSV